jgi:hypothetical protein
VAQEHSKNKTLENVSFKDYVGNRSNCLFNLYFSTMLTAAYREMKYTKRINRSVSED